MENRRKCLVNTGEHKKDSVDNYHYVNPHVFELLTTTSTSEWWRIRNGWAFVYTGLRDELDDSVIGVEIVVCEVKPTAVKTIGTIPCLEVGPGGAYCPLSILDDAIEPSGFCLGIDEAIKQAIELARSSALFHSLPKDAVHVSRWNGENMVEVRY